MKRRGKRKGLSYRKVLPFITTLLLEPPDAPLAACGHPGLQGPRGVGAVPGPPDTPVGSNTRGNALQSFQQQPGRLCPRQKCP